MNGIICYFANHINQVSPSKLPAIVVPLVIHSPPISPELRSVDREL
jgi:hypothetical protein